MIVISGRKVRLGLIRLRPLYGQLSSVRLTVIYGPHMNARTVFRWNIWDPGKIGMIGSAVVWSTCFCLIAMLRGNLVFDLRRPCLFILDLRNICGLRTIARDFCMQGLSTPPDRTALSSYLDVMYAD